MFDMVKFVACSLQSHVLCKAELCNGDSATLAVATKRSFVRTSGASPQVPLRGCALWECAEGAKQRKERGTVCNAFALQSLRCTYKDSKLTRFAYKALLPYGL